MGETYSLTSEKYKFVHWQDSCHSIKLRGQHIFANRNWADCRFLVGTNSNRNIISGHKLILAMASPVFERMFYGELAESSDPILIPDVTVDTFRSLMEYIYSDKVAITSFEKACDLWYMANKYLLPHLAGLCIQFLRRNLNIENACRTYEFARLYDELDLMKRCMNMITTQTATVLANPSFLDINYTTLLTIFDQNSLNIETELVLFDALRRYAEERGYYDSEPQFDKPKDNLYHQALKKIRFLTLTPRQFAEGPGRSNLLTQGEAFAILMKLTCMMSDYPIPNGFSANRQRRIPYKSNGYQTSRSKRLSRGPS